MSVILFLAVVALGVILADTRKRLKHLEERLSDLRLEHTVEPIAPIEAAAPTARPEPERPEPERPFQAAPEPALVEQMAPDPVWLEQAARALETPRAAPPEPAPTPFEAPNRFAAPSFSVNFEDLFGRKLPIWAGGITLIIAAVFLVRYSIEAGLLSPWVRVVLGGGLGLGLIGGAHLARARAEWVKDERVAQALAGAGCGALYAATLAAANLYGLIGPGPAFALLAAVTALTALLSLRFGPPCAVLGLIGGLAAPAMIHADQPNTPLLAAYIGLLIAGLSLLSRRQRWAWLGIAALVGGLGWSALMIVLGLIDTGSMLAVGMLVLVLGLALPMLADKDRVGEAMRLGGACAAALQLALLVAMGHFALLTWGLYGLLSLAFLWLARGQEPIRQLTLLPILTATGLLFAWPDPNSGTFALVLGGIVLIHGGHALAHLARATFARHGLSDAAGTSAIALGGMAAILWQFSLVPLDVARLALLMSALPAAGALAAWLGARLAGERPFAVLVQSSGLLLALALLEAAPGWTAPISLAGVAGLVLLVAIRARNPLLPLGALTFGLASLGALATGGTAEPEWGRLIGGVPFAWATQSILRWASSALAFAGLAWAFARSGSKAAIPLQVLAGLLGYGVLAQALPASWLAPCLAALAVLITLAMARFAQFKLVPLVSTLSSLCLLWALGPAAHWLDAGFGSLLGDPVLTFDLPLPGEALRRLLLPAALVGLALWCARDLPHTARLAALGLAGLFGTMGLHVLYKQVFAIATPAQFVVRGLAERTVWEALLLGAAWLVWTRRRQAAATLTLAFAALAHGLFYTIILHNPLWSAQAMGAWPLANLVLPAYGVPAGALWLIPRVPPLDHDWSKRAARVAAMGLIVLFTITCWRQLFAGSLVRQAPVGAFEDIVWSLSAVVLAVGYLLWGIRRQSRDWRIGSLVLMLGAVGKVFLFDASGLTGLLRIASFLALGISLIGIGWLYSRQLNAVSGTD